MSARPAWNRAEQALVRRLRTPEKVQGWLESLRYNYEEDGRPTLRSLRRVVRDGLAHCIEGALGAAAILAEHGHPPLLLCMEARDIDHNVCLFRRDGRWGAVAQSRDPNLKYRPPRFRRLRDLVLSYHPYYWNLRTGDETDLSLRGYARLDLRRLPRDWATAEEDLLFVEDALYALPYRALFPRPGRTLYLSTREEKLIWVR